MTFVKFLIIVLVYTRTTESKSIGKYHDDISEINYLIDQSQVEYSGEQIENANDGFEYLTEMNLEAEECETDDQKEEERMLMDVSVRGGKIGEQHRWRNYVYFAVDNGFPPFVRQLILQYIRFLDQIMEKYVPCLRLREYDFNPVVQDVIIITPHPSICDSRIGRVGGTQTIRLKPSCIRFSIIIHEIFHALGLFHEQTRPDRDEYIKVHFENIVAGKEKNFEKQHQLLWNMEYDIKSIMHYSPGLFSRNGKDTISIRRREGENEYMHLLRVLRGMGGDAPTNLDIQKLQKLQIC